MLFSSIDNIVAFDAKVDEFHSDVLTNGPKEFAEYYESRVHILLRDHVVAGISSWTNKNC